MGLRSGRRAPWWVTISALIGAAAALALPGPAGPATGVAAVLAVGALALLAGHAWGVLVTGTAQVVLVGNVWPLLALQPPPDAFGTAAIVTALVSALPGLAMIGWTLPAVVDVVLGEERGERARGYGVACGAVVMALVLVLPAV